MIRACKLSHQVNAAAQGEEYLAVSSTEFNSIQQSPCCKLITNQLHVKPRVFCGTSPQQMSKRQETLWTEVS
jgi:hypothetical protein